MQLIGMLDSPFVRRTAISMQLLGIAYEHKSISVFSTYAQFKTINPVVKAPTLVCDDGTTLMDSTLIIDYLETMSGRSLLPRELGERQRCLRLLGLALAICEKTMQTVYERQLRPADKQHEPWANRVKEQLFAACTALDRELTDQPLACDMATIDQAGVTVAVAWRFLHLMLPEMILPSEFPAIDAHAQRAEELEAFIAAPPV